MEQTVVQKAPEQAKKPASNLTGIPTQMKLDFERRSGLSFDDVRVHYNSDKPAKIGALAYTQGNQVHVGPGQERHLRHELGHVVQQKCRIITPTTRVGNTYINDSCILEEEANHSAFGNIRTQSVNIHCPQTCVQRMKISTDEEGNCVVLTGNWVVLTKTLPAKDKTKIRNAFAKNVNMVKLSDGRTATLEENDFKSMPENITDFYSQITEHMASDIYWINHESYATGDLSSLAAFVINEPRFGIRMTWREIGTFDPLTNMSLLAQFLGGVVDYDDKHVYYVVTDEGAKATWGASGTRNDNKPLSLEDDITLTLEHTSLEIMDSARQWMLCHNSLIRRLPEELDHIVPLMAYRCGDLAQKFAKIINDPSTILTSNVLKLQAELFDIAFSFLSFLGAQGWIPPFELPSTWRESRTTACMDSAQSDPPITNYHRLAKIAWQRAVRFRAITYQVTLYLKSQLQHQCVAQTLPFRELTKAELPRNNPRRLSYTDGTMLVATTWDQTSRNRLRLAWGLDNYNGTGLTRDYDTEIENWLESKKINPTDKIVGKNIVILWIRKSGERGGAHFEQDTSFSALKQRALYFANQGMVVFLAGDKTETQPRTSDFSSPNIFDITCFWADNCTLLLPWQGNTRIGQFRLYDYLNRRASSLTHIGSRSGNLEALALMGHKVLVLAHSREEDGVKRMLAFQTHDLATTSDHHISYDFIYRGEYDKTSAQYFVALQHRRALIVQKLLENRQTLFESIFPQLPQFDKRHKLYNRDLNLVIRSILIDGLAKHENCDTVFRKTFDVAVLVLSNFCQLHKEAFERKRDRILKIYDQLSMQASKILNYIFDIYPLAEYGIKLLSDIVVSFTEHPLVSRFNDPNTIIYKDALGQYSRDDKGDMGKAQEQLLDVIFIRSAKAMAKGKQSSPHERAFHQWHSDFTTSLTNHVPNPFCVDATRKDVFQALAWFNFRKALIQSQAFVNYLAPDWDDVVRRAKKPVVFDGPLCELATTNSEEVVVPRYRNTNPLILMMDAPQVRLTGRHQTKGTGRVCLAEPVCWEVEDTVYPLECDTFYQTQNILSVQNAIRILLTGGMICIAGVVDRNGNMIRFLHNLHIYFHSGTLVIKRENNIPFAFPLDMGNSPQDELSFIRKIVHTFVTNVT